jgi:hypothetical protein
MFLPQFVWLGLRCSAIAASAALVAAGCASVVDKSDVASGAVGGMADGTGGASSPTNSTVGEGSAAQGPTGSGGAGGPEDCTAPKVALLAAKQEWVTSIALDATNVYWGNKDLDANRIRTMPKAGGAVTVLVTTKEPPLNFAVDDTHVYWSEDHDVKTTLYSIVKTGGPSAPNVLAVTANSGCTGLSLDDDRVYWSGGAWIFSVPKDGSASLTELAKPDAMSIDDRHGLIADHDGLYWLESSTHISTMAKTGSAPMVLASLAIHAQGFAMDETRFYLGDPFVPPQGTGQLLALPRAGGTPMPLVTDLDGVFKIAATASCIYWTTGSQPVSQLRAVPKSGGNSIPIAQVDMFGGIIAADESGVYWGERENHQLMRATK